MRLFAFLLVAFLLAGCSDAVDRPPLSARAETREVPESSNYPGLIVRGTLRATPDGLAIDAVARNTGNRTYEVETGCTTPWSVELRRGDESVALREPMAHCLAFALADFGPGEVLAFTTTWDGTIWDETAGRQVAAPAGDYDWSVRFIAYRDAQEIKRFDLDFPVTVG